MESLQLLNLTPCGRCGLPFAKGDETHFDVALGYAVHKACGAPLKGSK